MRIFWGLLLALCAGCVALSAGPAEAFSVVEAGDSRSVAGSYSELYSTAASGEGVCFAYDADKRALHLMSKSKQKTYLTFRPSRDVEGNVEFEVKDIYTTDPEQHLWEIIAKGGENLYNCGYWIVGVHDGKYVNFVTLKSLTEIGYKSDGRHRLSSKLYGNGNLVIAGTYSKPKKDAWMGYQKDTVTDFRASLFWDEGKEWFGIRRLNQ